MNRRSFLISAAVGTSVVVAGGATWLNIPTTHEPRTMAAMAGLLNSFRGKTLVTTPGLWSPAHVFNHLTQNIEYSMAGFPESKGALFQTLLGKPALAIFIAKRAMSHNLTAPIPGGYDIPDTGNSDEAIDKLLAALVSFQAFSGPLKPHFAYGDLNKSDYELAHVLHFYDHMSKLHLQG